MPNIPLKHRKLIDADPKYRTCARKDEGDCAGRITIEEACLYAGKQIKEMWNYLPLCEKHHGIGAYWNCHGQNKKRHIILALQQATESDRKKYPRLPRHLIKYGTK